MSALAVVVIVGTFWLLAALFGLCLCRMAALGDRDDDYRREFPIGGQR